LVDKAKPYRLGFGRKYASHTFSKKPFATAPHDVHRSEVVRLSASLAGFLHASFFYVHEAIGLQYEVCAFKGA